MLTPSDLALHAQLGIDADMLAAMQIRRVDDHEARAVLSVNGRGGRLDGILYPYVLPGTTRPVTHRLRRDHPDVENGKPANKYISAYGDHRHLYFAPTDAALLADPTVLVLLVEAEKSVLAIACAARRLGRVVLPIGLGGYAGWRGRIGKTTDATGARVGEKGPLPDLDRVVWAHRDVVIAFDANAATNPSVQAGRRAFGQHLIERGATVRIAEVPVEAGINGPDDYIGAHGDVAFFGIVDGATCQSPASAADVLRLAGLDDVHGVPLADLEARLRQVKALLVGADALRRRTVRELIVAALKAEKVSGAAAWADAAIGGLDDTDLAEASADFLADDEPWPEPVEGAALLDTLVATVTRYVVLPSRHAALIVVLWIVLTYCDTAVDLLPILLLTSPTKRCGKTTTVFVVAGLACRALSVSNISAAALYRAIDKYHPTLILDEADTFINNDPELRGVINGGHVRHTANVIRCVGDDSEATPFSTWCPKLVAMIGHPQDTLLDRSLVIRLERKAAGETVAHLRADRVHLAFRDLRRQIRRWANDHLEGMRAADPALPPGLHDRAADNARPLVALAALAGGDWPARIAEAVIALAGADADENPIAEELLVDLYAIFTDEDADRLTTKNTMDLLVALDSKPWATYNTKAGKPITQVQIARLLKRFTVRPTKAKVDGKAENCYLRSDLEKAWKRYCPSLQVGTPEPTNESGPESSFSSRNRDNDGSDLKSEVSPMNTGPVPRFRPEAPRPRTREEL